ncbi:unnamed protein product [Taenia asiatica]|uniref:Heat shock protein 70 family n=1 Tax=Taenia asiatica TaxID=60517 RepID=A0A0R3WET0_TAEAS|nr:unnamed protein product [Taenia asiatica]
MYASSESQSTGQVIGIDLGTTFSCAGVFQNGKVEIIANDQGSCTTPSYVAFTNKERLIGEAAKNQAALSPTNTVFDAKRLIGRHFNDEWGKPIIEVKYRSETKRFIAEQILSMVLLRMKETAEAHLGRKMTNARQATIDAGKIAGLTVLRIVNEPTAAVTACSLDKRSASRRNVLVFDLGGGTFDVSILFIKNGAFEVKATDGGTHLGGEDFDSRIVEHCVEIFKQTHKGKDLTIRKKAISRLRKACEVAKRMLSSSGYTNIDVERLCSDLFSKTLGPVRQTLNDAELDKNDVHEILMVGGLALVPKIWQLLKEFFIGKQLNNSINPNEAAAYGAALLVSNLADYKLEKVEGLVLLEVAPLSLGVEATESVVAILIKRNTKISTKKTKIFSTCSNDQSSVLVQVYEGERAVTSGNNLLGKFELSGIPPVPRGVPQIGVSLAIDKNGILNVTAVHNSSGKQNSISIRKDKDRLSEKAIQQMRNDADKNEAGGGWQRELF